MPHLRSLAYFVTNTFPKPILISLAYRLSVMQLSSKILPVIGAEPWEESGIDTDESRPVRASFFYSRCTDAQLRSIRLFIFV